MNPSGIRPSETIRFDPLDETRTVFVSRNAYQGNYDYFGPSLLFPDQIVTTVKPEDALPLPAARDF